MTETKSDKRSFEIHLKEEEQGTYVFTIDADSFAKSRSENAYSFEVGNVEVASFPADVVRAVIDVSAKTAQ